MIDEVWPSRERMRELRETEEMGFYSARLVALREAMLEAIDGAKNVDDIKPILRTLVNKWTVQT